MCELPAFEVIAVDLQPVGRGRVRGGVAGSQDSRVVLALLADLDGIVRADFKRRNIDLAAIHQHVAVAHELAGLIAAGAESHAVHDAVQAPFERPQKILASDALLSGGLLEQVAELVLQQAVVAARFLLFAQLQAIANQFRLAILAVLAGSEVALLDGALFSVTALPFQKQFHSLSPAQPANRANVSSHSLSIPSSFQRCSLRSVDLRPAYYQGRGLWDVGCGKSFYGDRRLFLRPTSHNPQPSYTRRFFCRRHPLLGIGVRSFTVFTSLPTVDRARTADSRPAPGPLTRTSTERSPYSLALLAAVRDACWAANGVPFLDPRKPSEPELDQASTFPTRSVNVTMVLLKEAWM